MRRWFALAVVCGVVLPLPGLDAISAAASKNLYRDAGWRRGFAGLRFVDHSHSEVEVANRPADWDQHVRLEAFAGYDTPRWRWLGTRASLYVFGDRRRAEVDGGRVSATAWGIGMEGSVLLQILPPRRDRLHLFLAPMIRGALGGGRVELEDWQHRLGPLSGDSSGLRGEYGAGVDLVLGYRRFELSLGYGLGAWSGEDADVRFADAAESSDEELPERIDIEGLDRWWRLGLSFRY